MLRLLLLALLCAATARANPNDPNAAFLKEKVEALYQEGLTLYQAGRFREALPKFEAAHTLFADPQLLYNIGRCHEELGELDIARTRYEALITDPTAPDEVKTKAATRKAAIDARPLVQPLQPPTVQLAEVEITPWLVIGTGAVAVTAGIAFITFGIADHTEREQGLDDHGPPISSQKARELDESGANKKTAGGALLGLGATAVGVGVYLLLDDDAVVAPTAGLNGLGLTGRF